MSIEVMQLVLTAALAVIAVVAALVAVRATRVRHEPAEGRAGSRRRKENGSSTTGERGSATTENHGLAAGALESVDPQVDPLRPPPLARVVEGKVLLTPTTKQIVDVTMSRPLVRVSVLSYGLAHALRPESRDRIVALMRREFRSRRRQRRLAAKRAARLVAPPRPATAQRAREMTTESWLGELPVTRERAHDREAIAE